MNDAGTMDINDLVRESHDRAIRKGFYDLPPSVENQLLWTHKEVDEVWDAFRRGMLSTTHDATGKPVGVPAELADVVIMVCDIAGYLGIDLVHEIRMKSDYNETRPPRHGLPRVTSA